MRLKGLTGVVAALGAVVGSSLVGAASAAAAESTAVEQVAPDASGVRAQQEKLNELLTPFGFPELAVDGDSGPKTEQAICTYRVAMALPVSRADIEVGSEEERQLMATTALPIPAVAPTSAERWAVIDQTCQVFIAGEGTSRMLFIFPASTGVADHPTRSQDAVRAVRYDPAVETAGWHNSTLYPVALDNPLEGNMYKPIYFDEGQAIHGANTVPTSPASKGCVRLKPGYQDYVVSWLGLQDLTEVTWKQSRINLTVTVVGQY